ncbi:MULTISPECIES: lipid-A-disaccharide synthase [unclassified Leptolyngbya]|uniref:lipid-A-disaccharide synthase n=1 Tax=unclassified Leptolyngbya TaxID=2650499 RepID=UPI00168797D8|nr:MULTISPECIES: lipid-A-disaccharide synthase [unclassified Leptolyngbya]MBD1911305.1 lipid-A-disaccharide synthase [Leptolyngbya sp. FACHB-8]MBD2156677.1 lipid-A-disaccharide synthase [Leptolyngbya sp. FACHB-16]
MVKLFISTGEVSGDLQGALLVSALRRQAEKRGVELEILALGGDRMAAAGATLVGNTLAIGAIGIFEALPYVLPTLQVQGRAKNYLKQNPPDAVVMVDYLSPNLSIGKFTRKHLPEVPTVYYIAPQEWVWAVGNANTLGVVNLSDRILAVFPQEATHYQKWGGNVTHVGHPLIDQMAQFPSREQARKALGIAPDELAIALLPASRRQELTYLLPVIAEAAQRLQAQVPQARFWIPVSQEGFRPKLESAVQQYGLRAAVVEHPSQTVIAAADLAITKSGTVNLEIALMNVPQVVLYRVNPLTAWVARKLLNFKIPFMSPPNLVLMEGIVPELLQELATPDAIVQEALPLLAGARRQKMLADYERVRQAMGEPGVCDRTANIILDMALAKL